MDLTCSNRPGNMRNRLLWSERLYPMYRLPSQFLMVAEIGPFEGKVSILGKVRVFQRDSLCFTKGKQWIFTFTNVDLQMDLSL